MCRLYERVVTSLTHGGRAVNTGGAVGTGPGMPGVDRRLLGDQSMVLLNLTPMSPVGVAKAVERCAGVGVSFVQAAVSGGGSQAECGQLHLWVAPGPVPSMGGRGVSSCRDPVRACRDVLCAVAEEYVVVGGASRARARVVVDALPFYRDCAPRVSSNQSTRSLQYVASRGLVPYGRYALGFFCFGFALPFFYTRWNQPLA